MKNINCNQKGIALVISLLVVAVVIVLSSIYVTRAVFEKSMSNREIQSAKANYAAEAGGNAGLEKLQTLINTNMLSTVNAADPATFTGQAANYVANNDSLGFLVAYTKSGTTFLLTLSGSQASYSGTTSLLNNNTSNYLYTIIIKANGNPSTVSNNPPQWNFPYTYQIQTTGTDGNQVKKFTLNGNFSIQVRKDNFARFALFTNSQTMPNGSSVWFTSSTNFSGPLFTNGRYSFAKNPSGTFTDTVKQVNATAAFYNNGSPVNLNANANGAIDVPNFLAGFTRSVASISIPGAAQESAMQTQATGGNVYANNGIYVPNSAGALTGGIYVRGDANISMSTNGSGHPVYTITQGGTTKTITINPSTNQTSVTVGAATTTYNGIPDGQDNVGTTFSNGNVANIGTIIYVNGDINNLGGTVQQNSQVLIAAHDDIVIQNHITYQNKTAAVGTPGTVGYVPPSAEGYVNLLGILSWGGDVRIGTSAPNNVNIDATVMAQSGIFAVDNYDTTAVRGTATVLGGVITNHYGAFGTFNGATGLSVSGYGRNFNYDTRMQTQYTPPYFPTLNTFIAVTNDINKKFWQSGGF